jgi:hypothetical protein
MPDEQPDKQPDRWWKTYQPLITWSVIILVTTVTTTISALVGVRFAPIPAPVIQPTVETVREVPVPVWAEGEWGHPYTGWVSDSDAVAAVSAQLEIKVFSDTPAGQVPARDLPKSVYGWKAYVNLFGRPPPVKNQFDIGSCVSFGTNTAVERTLAAEILRRKGAPAEFSLFAEEATYGGSRVEVGGGRIRGDGSVGAWAAQFVTKWGMVPRQKYDTIDLTTYSTTICRDWGRAGVPPEFEAVARRYPIKSTVRVNSWADAKASLAQDYNIAVCSNQGFSRQRDARGVVRAQGNWAHCMALDGYHTDEGGSEYGHITNSWGETYHTGPVGWGDPNPDGFWVESAVIDRMLKQGDSWSFSGVTGFPARKPLDWSGRGGIKVDVATCNVDTRIPVARTPRFHFPEKIRATP